MRNRLRRRALLALTPLPLALGTMLPAAGPALAHEVAAPSTGLTSQEARNQVALQQVLAQNTPGDAEHVAEHEAVQDGEREFSALPAARRAAVRQGVAAAAKVAAAAAPGPDAARVGAWTQAPFLAPTYALNTVLLPTGKVLVFSMGSGNASCQQKCAPGDNGNAGFNVNNDGAAAVWDPTRGTGAGAFKILPPPDVDLTGYDLTAVRKDPVVDAGNKAVPMFNEGAEKLRPAPIFCSGQVQTADGRVLIAGGNLEARGDAYGLRMSFLFDPFTEQWTREPDLQHARWYPTLTRTASGRVAILGGRNELGKDVASIEMYPEQGVPVPGVGAAAPGTTGLKTTSLFDDAADPANPLGDKTAPSGTKYSDALGYYPFSQVLPDGTLGISRWQTGRVGMFDEASGTFRYLGNTSYKSALGKYATAFPAPGDQFGTPEMIMAGGLNINADYSPGPTPLKSTWSIRPSESAKANGPDWQAQPDLNVARRFAGATLLPDGSAVIVGGGGVEDRIPIADIENPERVPQRQIELWDPTTRQWTLGPAQVVPRAYHSTSVLLPDGRVLSGGDDWVSYVLDANRADAYDSTFELYSPPYLFQANGLPAVRPTIDTLPARIEFRSTFAVEATSPSERPIVKATLVAPGSVTHAYDDNQRVLQLPVTAGPGGTYTVTAPDSGNAAPPGDYMLFLLDDRGVPSVGRFLRVASEHASGGATPTPGPGSTPRPTVTPNPTATPNPAATPTPEAMAPVPSTVVPVTAAPGPLAPVSPLAPPATTAPATPRALTPLTTTKPKPAPAVRLSGRRLRVALTITRSSGRKRCATRVTASTRVSGRTTTRRLPVRSTKVSGKVTCRVTGSFSLPKTPGRTTEVRVSFRATGLNSRVITAQRS